mmetsp:Transcript_14431/g.40988  ORF Transcript_14431/g.40988 Transcript_14431/m.40988 type:complete len:381 (+) Transcript_14431:177-1319(+)
MIMIWFIPLLWELLFFLSTTQLLSAVEGGGAANRQYSVRLPGRPYETSWDDDEADDRRGDANSGGDGGIVERKGLFMGTGREFDIFDQRSETDDYYGKRSGVDVIEFIGENEYGDDDDNGDERWINGRSTSRRVNRGGSNRNPDDMYNPFNRPPPPFAQPPERSPFMQTGRNSGRGSPRNQPRQLPKVFQNMQDWWSERVTPNLKDLPKIAIRVEPTTTLKIRKTFRPLKTIIRIGADYNTQVGVWQFKSSWEDAIIGGKLTLAGRELQLSKSWQLSVGAVEDLVTRLRFRAAIDLTTFKGYARIGFRTERLSPINVMEGFTLMRRLPLDGGNGNVKLEVKANFALPEPEIEYSTETQRSMVGMGDIEVSIDELNLLLDY